MKRNLRQIILDGKDARVPLTLGLEAIVDIGDVGLIDGANWTAQVSGAKSYARMNVSRDGRIRKVYMHRLILGFPDGMQVDHINGNGLDNRRENLRPATNAQNQQNRRIDGTNKSGFKGVCWHKAMKAWHAQIKANGAKTSIGFFPSPEEAHAAYADASAKLHGKFGRLK